MLHRTTDIIIYDDAYSKQLMNEKSSCCNYHPVVIMARITTRPVQSRQPDARSLEKPRMTGGQYLVPPSTGVCYKVLNFRACSTVSVDV
jgi:hypothetical protein